MHLYSSIDTTAAWKKLCFIFFLWNCTEPKIDNILRKNQNGFRRNRSTTSQILTICRILEGVRAKNLQVTLLFVDFTKAFDSIHRGKMEQILVAYSLPKETVAAITILYKNTHVKVRPLLSIQAYLNNAVVWIVSTHPLLSKSSSPYTNPLVTALGMLITIGITITFMFHTFFSCLASKT